jgi:protease I
LPSQNNSKFLGTKPKLRSCLSITNHADAATGGSTIRQSRLVRARTVPKGKKMQKIDNEKILIMSTNGFEQSELEVPLTKLKDAGATVHVATPDGKDIKGWKDGNWGDTVAADIKISDVVVDDYICVVLPGGQINPDILRADEIAVQKVRDFVTQDKIVAAICHAPWLLIEAGVVDGREMTGYKSIHTDLKNAGAQVIDAPVAISNGIITSRSPEDLDAFVAKIIEEVREGEHPRNAA